MEDEDSTSSCEFKGFFWPGQDYYTNIPNDWFLECFKIDNKPELKVILYLTRHTWGYKKRDAWLSISVNEFMYGRWGSEGRLDDGTGLSEQSVRDGLHKAIEHGYVLEKVIHRDRARIEKLYKLKMLPKPATPEPEEEDESEQWV